MVRQTQFREVLKGLSNLICLCSGRTITFMNPAGARLLGHADPRSFVGQDFQDFVPETYREIFAGGFDMVVDDDQAFPLKLRRLDDREIEAEMRVSRLDEGEERLFIVEVRDIGEIKRSATKVVEREQLLGRIMQSMADGLLTFDEAGVIHLANPTAEDMFGYGTGGLVGRKIENIIAEDRPEPRTKRGSYYFGLGLVTEGEARSEITGFRRGGSRFPVDARISQVRGSQRGLYIAVVRDITERRQAEEDRLRLAATVFDTTSEGMMVTDRDSRILAVNPAFTTITGYSAEEAIGKEPGMLRSGRHDDAFFKAMWGDIRRQGRWEGEIWNRRKNGEAFPQWLSIVAMTENDRVKHYVGVFRDISKTKEDEERIRYQANFDALTGLANRSLFFDRLTHAVVGAQRQTSRVGLMFIDLDGFKLVNDTLGHGRGDILLIEAAERLQKCVRDTDTVCRLGGDEFTIILEGTERAADAVMVAQRALAALSEPFILEGQEAFVSASIGISVFPEDARDPQQLLKNADVAMYRAKEKGKASFQFFTQDLNDDAVERLVLRNGLVKAMDRKEFELYYQAKKDLATGRIVGAEALLRWNSASLGWVPPVKFIPVLEDAGMIRDVGQWIIETACRQHAALRAAGHGDVSIAVNLSARQLLQPTIARSIRQAIEDAGIEPTGLQLEITESMLMSEPERTAPLLNEIRAMGVKIAMDDFGTGYSSLSYLKRFPIDSIKIDRSFIADISEDPDDVEIIRAIITMGHALGRTIVAEGVETEEQMHILGAFRCQEAQGYLISKPLPAAAFMKFLDDQPPRPASASVGAAG